MKKNACFTISVALLFIGCSQSANVTFIELKEEPGRIAFARFTHFSPDGKKFATVNEKGRMTRIWDAESGEKLQELKGLISVNVSAHNVSFDRGKILTSDLDEVVDVWDVKSGKKLHSLEGSHAFFSPDGKKVVTLWGPLERRTARIWDVESGKELQELEGGWPVTISPDGKKIVLRNVGVIHIFDVESGRKLQTLEGSFNAFSPDSKRIVTLGGVTLGGDGTPQLWFQLWDTGSGVELGKFEGKFRNFSPDGKKMAVANVSLTSDGEIVRILDSDSGRELHKFKGQFASFSPDGKQIVAGSLSHPAVIWDADSGKRLHVLKGGLLPVFSSDGKRIITIDSDKITRVWDTESGKNLLTLGGQLRAFSPDGKRIATAHEEDGTIRIWTLE